jgi:hypothetical protein
LVEWRVFLGVKARSDPHTNLFYYYRAGGTNRERERQLENNTTKALIYTLGKNPDFAKSLLREFGISVDDQHLNYSLQKRPRNSRELAKRPHRYVLGICQTDEMEAATTPPTARANTRPDAWIWSDNFVIVVENKVIGGLDANQMMGHAEILGHPPAMVMKKMWTEVYDFIRRRGNRSDTVEELRKYLELVGLSGFVGFEEEDFDGMLSKNREEKRRVKDRLRTFLEAVYCALPSEAANGLEFRVGTLGEDPCVWGTMYQKGEKDVDVMHYNWLISYSSLQVGAMLEGKKAQAALLEVARSSRDQLIGVIKGLTGCSLVLFHRRKRGIKDYPKEEAIRISIDKSLRMDFDHLFNRIEAMEDFAFWVVKDYRLDEVCEDDPETLVGKVASDVRSFKPLVDLVNSMR